MGSITVNRIGSNSGSSISIENRIPYFDSRLCNSVLLLAVNNSLQCSLWDSTDLIVQFSLSNPAKFLEPGPVEGNSFVHLLQPMFAAWLRNPHIFRDAGISQVTHPITARMQTVLSTESTRVVIIHPL